jgi:hypothetical protein
VVNKLALIIAAVAAIPSFAAFTPAVLMSLVALLMASYPACAGELRVSALTFVAVTIAVVGSPIFTLSNLRDSLLLCSITAIPYGLFLFAYFLGLRRKRQLIRSGNGGAI